MVGFIRFCLCFAAVCTLSDCGASSASASARAADSLRSETLPFDGAGQTLSGLLLRPQTSISTPAVVLVTEPWTTDLEHSRFMPVVQSLLAQGLSVFLVTPDDRSITFDQQARDIGGAIRSLRSRSDIQPANIGLWTEDTVAAWVGPLVAAKDPQLAFMVLIAAPMETPGTFELRNIGQALLEQEGFTEPIVDRITRFRSALWDYLASGEGYEPLVAELGDLRVKPWYPSSGLPHRVLATEELGDLPHRTLVFLEQRGVEPSTALSLVACPILAVYGDEDRKMPTAEFAVKLHFLAAAADLDLAVRSYPGIGHDLTTAVKESTAASPIAPQVLSDLVKWTWEQVGGNHDL